MFMHASVPPHTAISASLARIRRAASPIAWMPAAHAVTGAPSGPLKPWRIEMWPAARFTRKEGIVNGDRRRTPRWSTVRTASVMAGNPPMPEAMIVAVRRRSVSEAGFQCACASASSAAASAKRMNRSTLRWSFGAITAFGSKPASGFSSAEGTTPPAFAGRSPTKSSESLRMPERPARRRDQDASTPAASGLSAPRPVTTTRRIYAPVDCGTTPESPSSARGWRSATGRKTRRASAEPSAPRPASRNRVPPVKRCPEGAGFAAGNADITASCSR